MVHLNGMMRVINLASGSDGNMTYVDTEDTKIILDMGLSCAEAVRRLSYIGIRPEEITGILVTHEHGDHTKGLDVFCSRYDKPIYANKEVWENLDKRLTKVRMDNRKLFDGDEFQLGDITVNPIKVPHDVPCFAFSFKNNENKISILTDLGHTNDRILRNIQGSQIVYIESNYDKLLLSKNENYPLVLKRRIAGPEGHLSNDDCAEFISALVITGTRQIVLSHLSRDNNSPDIAFDTVCKNLLKEGIVEGMHVKIDVATNRPGVIFKLK